MKIIFYIALLLSSVLSAQTVKISLPVVNQGVDGNCLACAMSSMMKHEGRNVSMKYIYDSRKDEQEIDLSDIERILKLKAYRIKTIEELKTKLSDNKVCLINLQMYDRTSRMWYPTDSKKVIGMHSMLVVGYNPDGFLLQNSWGTEWGDNGYCIFPYEDWKWKWEIITFN
jgi:C1A family cysteine protease